MSSDNHPDLLAELHKGVFEQPLWSTFLKELNGCMRADQVLLSSLRGDAPNSEVTRIFAGAPSREDQARYFDRLFSENPKAYHSLRPGQVYTLQEMLDHAHPGEAAHHHARLIALGPQFFRIVRLVEQSGSSAWLMASRYDSDFDHDAERLLAALSPQMMISLRIFAEIERGRMRADISNQAIRRLNFGWLTLDARGFVLDIDPGAQEFLSHISAIQASPNERLILAGDQSRRLFAESLRSFAANHINRPRALHISSDPWLNMLLVPMRERTLHGDKTPLLIAYFHGDSRSSADRCEQLVDLFGLTPREALFALELSQGRSIVEAAAEMGITVESARNYSKRVYAKTGARGQVELVRFILTSVISLA